MSAATAYVPYTSVLFHDLVAPLVIGNVISFIFFGIGLVQAYQCLNLLHKLPYTGQEKLMFWYLMILLASDMIDTVGKGLFLTDHLHNVVVGGLLGSAVLPKTAFFLPILDGWISSLNHLAYGHRVWKISPERGVTTYVLLAAAAVISITQFIFSCYSSLWILRPVASWTPSLIPYATVWMGGAAVADVLLVFLFVYYLSSHKSKTEFRETHLALVRWINLSIETGLLPAVAQCACLILFLTFPDKPYEITFAIILPKIYINGILLVMHTILCNRARAESVIESSVPAGKSTPALPLPRHQQDISRFGKPSKVTGITTGQTIPAFGGPQVQVTHEIHCDEPIELHTGRGHSPSEKGMDSEYYFHDRV